MTGEQTSDPARQRGMALVSVLWGISILSVIATVALAASLSYARIEANSWRETRGRTLAEAAVVRAVLGLIDTRPAQRWRVDGVPTSFSFEGTETTVTIHDELGKIDLNTAREDILRNLFHAVVSDPNLADALTDRVLDWRAPGDLKRLNGATSNDYERAGSAFRPRGGPFQSVDELNLVLGMTPTLFAAVAPAVTVYSNRSTIDPQVAPKLALRAATGGNSQSADALVAARSSGAARGTLDPMLGLGGRTFTITVDVALGKRHAIHEAVIRLTGDPLRPYWILAWGPPPPHPKAE